jgi:pilus assembly protein CpaC
MKKFNFLIITALLSLWLFPAQAQDQPVGKKYLTLYIGTKHREVLSFLPPGAEFHGNHKGSVRIRLDRERKILDFEPLKEGVKTLTMHDRKGEKLFEYRIDIRKTELTKTVREVRALLHDIEGVQVKIVNNKVLIDGQVLLAQDLNRIYGVIRQFGSQVDSLVEISPIAQRKIAELIERDINNPDIEVRAVNGKFILTGIANSPDEKEKAEIIAKTYMPPPIINEAEAAKKIKKPKGPVVLNFLSIRAKPQPAPDKIIQLVVHYVELSKTYLRSSSFQWAPSLQDNTDVRFTQDSRQNNDGIVAEISGVINNLLPRLNHAKQHGHARILKVTSVTTKDRRPGVIDSNIVIPYVVRQPGANGQIGVNTAEQAEVGISSNITPTIINQRSDVIQLDMKFSMSTLIGNTSAGPQTARNRVNTVVDVRSGQSAAIGGLISTDTGTEYNPDADPQALFNLYSAKDFRRNKNQFVVFVTPIIKASASSGSEKVKRKFRLRE